MEAASSAILLPCSHVRTSGLAIARAGAFLFALKIGGCGLGLAMQVALARLLGVGAFGVFATALNAATLIAVVASCGIPFSAVRFLPSHLALGRGDLARGFLKVAGIVTIAGGAVSAVALLVAAFIMQDAQLARPLALAAPLVLVFTGVQTGTALLQGLQRPLRSEFPMLVVRPLIVIAAALGLAWSARLDEVSAVLATALASTVALIMVLWWTAAALRPLGLPARSAMDLRSWLGCGSVMILLVSGAALNERLDVLMVAGLSNAGDAGVYSAAARFAQLISLAPAAAAARAAPLLSEAWARNDRATLARTTAAISRTSVALAVTFGLVLIACGGPLLRLFGTGFEESVSALRVLVFGHLALAAAGATAPLLVVAGRERKAAAILGASLCLNAALNLVLVPMLGLLGAALATAFAMSLAGFGQIALVQRELGLRVWLTNEAGP